MSDYQRSNFNRDDPRLRSKSPASKSPPRDPRNRTSSTSSWDNQTNHTSQFTQPSLQTSYQHLQYNSQYPNQNYYTGYENYSNYYQYNHASQQYSLTGGTQPGPPGGEDYPQAAWAPVSAGYNRSGDSKNKDGVAQELNKQKAGWATEREAYEERVEGLLKKFDLLVQQKDQLSSKHSPNRETLHIIKENGKLQVEIQNKIRDANNAIEILSGLIGDKKDSADHTHTKSAKDDGGSSSSKGDKVNYKHYDPEIHWCRMCDVFPLSAKEFLVHLHTKEHQNLSQDDVPWHKLPPEPKYPVYEDAPVRRLPIKGLQFFVPCTAWYCQLCDVWIGDLHCASQHLMSVVHVQNYSNFVEQNPHWEIEWLKDREKALERVKKTKNGSDSEDKKKKKKRKDKYSPTNLLGKEKKKKKRSKRRRKHSSDSSSSSSSSSSSEEDERADKSKSIRVAMRNKIKMFENEDKWDILGKLVEERKRHESKSGDKKESPKEDKLMSQWMTISEAPPKEKQLLDTLKEKLKLKQDAEKAIKVAAEYEASQRQKERDDYDRKQRDKERQEALDREEDEKRREKMSMKLKDVKFNKGRDNYRRRKSPSPSPERHRSRRSRSPSEERKSSKNGRRSFDQSPSMRYNKESDRDDERRDDYKREKKPPPSYKRLPFIGRIPQFKNHKGNKKPDEDKEPREIQKEDYDIPRKTRFQPGNLARAFIPEPEVVCFPKLSTYPPIAPPPPALKIPIVPEPPKISAPKPPPPPKMDKKPEPKPEPEPEPPAKEPEAPPPEAPTAAQDEYNMLYEDSSNNMMYPYGNMDYNNMYPNQSHNFMQVMQNENDAEIPSTHKMPLQPPPLPPDDPNDDLAMLGISSDDMAVQQMY